MKNILTINQAKEELKRLQKFYKENCISYESHYFAGKITNLHEEAISLEDLKLMCQHLQELEKLYKKNNLIKLERDVENTMYMYQLMLVIGETNKWSKIENLDFSDAEFEKNSEFIFQYLKSLEINARNSKKFND